MRHRMIIAVFAVVLFLTMAPPAVAAPYLTYTAAFNSTAQAWTYNLTLFNFWNFFTTGVIVVNGYGDCCGIVFGLDGSSVITPPGNGWGFQAPLPPFANNLSYFSPNDAADVAPNGVFGTFSFQSLKDPNTLQPGDFDIVLVKRGGTDSVDVGDAVNAPEPASLIPFALATACLLARQRRTPISKRIQ